MASGKLIKRPMENVPRGTFNEAASISPNEGITNSALLKKLLIWAHSIGADINNRQGALLLKYAQIVYNQNKNIRLTGTLILEDIIRKHIIDSLAAAPLIKKGKGAELMDIGSGAGLPGLVLKIAKPGMSATLIDSNRKKSEFIETTAELLGLKGVTVINDRAERAGKNIACREKYDVVVCRAVSRLNVITEYALPFLKIGGDFVAYKGPSAKKETDESMKAIHILGGGLLSITKLALPEGNEQRRLVLIRKLRSTPINYPRRTGVSLKKPIRG